MTNPNKESNEAFIKKFKKDNKILNQTKLPTPVDVFNKKLIADDCLLTDGMHWKKWCEEFKYDPMAHLEAMQVLIDICKRCSCAPWQLVNLAVSNFGFTKFTDDTIFTLRDNMLTDVAEDEEDEEDVDIDDEIDEIDDEIDHDDDDELADVFAKLEKDRSAGNGPEPMGKADREYLLRHGHVASTQEEAEEELKQQEEMQKEYEARKEARRAAFMAQHESECKK